MDYISTKETAAAWGIHPRLVQQYCKVGRIPGARKYGNSWMIPIDAHKPQDPRRARRDPAEARAAYLTCGLVGLTRPLPKDGPDRAAEDPDERLDAREQLRAELAYLRGDPGPAAERSRTVGPEEPIWPCVCLLAALAEQVFGAAAGCSGAIDALHELAGDADDPLPGLMALGLDVLAPQGPPRPVPAGADGVAGLPGPARPLEVCAYAHALLRKGRYVELLAADRAALVLNARPQSFTLLDLYLPLLCAVACQELGRGTERRAWLSSAVALAVPHGLILPFALVRPTFGRTLDRLLCPWPEQAEAVRRLDAAVRTGRRAHKE
mgnify:FL=1